MTECYVVESGQVVRGVEITTLNGLIREVKVPMPGAPSGFMPFLPGPHDRDLFERQVIRGTIGGNKASVRVDTTRRILVFL